MTTDVIKAIVRDFYAAFERVDIEALREILSPDLIAHNPNPQSRDAHIQGIIGWTSLFGDNQFDIVEQIAEGNLVATRVTLHCIHNKGDFQGVPPSGKRITIPAITYERFGDGKIVERFVFSDRLGLMQQMGLIPSH